MNASDAGASFHRLTARHPVQEGEQEGQARYVYPRRGRIIGSRSPCNRQSVAGEPPEMPLPQDARTIFQGILCVIAVLACLYIAQDIVLPVVLATVLKLLLQPLVSLLERVHVPKAVGH
jgi:hypothetical protein